MAKSRTDTEAVVKLVINGQQAKTSAKELTDAYRRFNTELSNMKKADDPKAYLEKAKNVRVLKAAMDEAKKEAAGLSNESKKLATNWKDIAAGVVGGFGIAGAIGLLKGFGAEVFATTAKFQKLEAILTTTLGSKGQARLVMQQIQEFAAKTPFQVDELTDAYVRLANQGFKPNMDQLRSLGDLSSSTGKDFAQLAEAMIDAQTGEFERLKEFGIRAEKDGDKVRFTFKGITQEVGFTAASIRNYITELGNIEGVAGSMAGISETLSGKVSNLGDSWDSLLKTVGEETDGVFSGAIDIMGSAITSITEYIRNLNIASKYKAGGSSFWERVSEVGTMMSGGPNLQAVKRDAFADVSSSLDQRIGDAKSFRELIDINDDLISRIKTLDRSTTDGAAAYQLYADKLKLVTDRSKSIASEREQKKLIELSDAAKLAAKEAEKQRKEEEKLAKQAAKKAITEFGQLNESYRKLGIDRLNDTLSANEKEVANEEKKYDELILKERDFLKLKGATAEQRAAIEKQISSLEMEKSQAVATVRVRQEAEMLKKIKELRTSLNDVHESELQKQKDHINKFYDDLELENAGNEKVLAQIRLDRERDLTDAEIREKRRLEEEKKGIEDHYDTLSHDAKVAKLADINKKYDDEIEALKKKFSKEIQLTEAFQDAIKLINENRAAEIKNVTLEDQKEELEAIIQGVQLLSDTTFQIMNNNLKTNSDLRLSQIQKNRDAELANQELTDSQKKAINDKYDKQIRREKLRVWKAEQRAAIAQAIINGAIGVTAAWKNPLIAPFTIPLIIGTTAAQIAVIAAQKAPQFAKGGMVPKGPSHSQGGINLVDNITGAVLGEMEGGEPILSKETYRNNKSTIDALLYSSQRKSGANISLDTKSIAMGERTYRSGGIMARTNEPSGSNSPTVVNVDMSDLKLLMGEMIDAVREEKERPAVLNYRLIEKKRLEMQKINDSLDA